MAQPNMVKTDWVDADGTSHIHFSNANIPSGTMVNSIDCMVYGNNLTADNTANLAITNASLKI